MANSQGNNPPVGVGDILVDLGPNRLGLGLPAIFQTFSHPKRRGRGRILYYIEDTSKTNLRRVARLEKTLKIPQGLESVAVEQGMI
jgi:hypothetical protein